MLTRKLVPPPEHLYPPDPWRVVEARLSEEFAGRAETGFALSNGYLGVRGTLEEGWPALSPGMFVNGFHETWPTSYVEDSYGLARVGQTMLHVPDTSVIQLFVDDEPLFLPSARTRAYTRVLDLRAGTLTRDLVWTTSSGKHVTIRSCRLVSLEHRHIMAMTCEVSVDRPAPVVLVSRVVDGGRRAGPGDEPVDGGRDPHLGRRLDPTVLQCRLAEGGDGGLLLADQTRNSGMSLAVGVQHVVETACAHEVVARAAPEASEVVVTADAVPGAVLHLTKVATYRRGRHRPAGGRR